MNTTKELGKLVLTNSKDLIPAIQAYTGQIATLCGFPVETGDKIQLAIEEACLNVINNSFNPGESGEFDITFYRRTDGIEIHVHDMGVPYDPSKAPVFDPHANLMEHDLEGLGMFLISKTMDEYRFNNLGIRGKETVLIKYHDATVIAAETDTQVEPEIVEPPASQPVEQINFNIRVMKAEEALEVCRCIYDCYGYSYANENIYFPERVAAMNQNGKLRSAVALTDDGEMGGHFALIFYEKLPAEVGIAVTKQKFRGQGFARQLGEFLEMEARAANLRGVQVKEVTAHPYTQKFCIKLGYKDCGLLLAHSPKSLSFKGINDKLKQRNSDVLGFKYLETPQEREIYAPVHHREMIELLYNNIGDNVRCIAAESTFPQQEKSVTEVNVYALRSLAEMFVLEYGEDFIAVMRQEMRKVFKDEIQVIELYLSLNDPLTQVMVPMLESMGFIFTGILPETHMGDALIMQYFNGVYIDYSQIVLVTDVAKQLLEYVQRHDPNMADTEGNLFNNRHITPTSA